MPRSVVVARRRTPLLVILFTPAHHIHHVFLMSTGLFLFLFPALILDSKDGRKFSISFIVFAFIAIESRLFSHTCPK